MSPLNLKFYGFPISRKSKERDTQRDRRSAKVYAAYYGRQKKTSWLMC